MRYCFRGLIFGGANFRNFTVLQWATLGEMGGGRIFFITIMVNVEFMIDVCLNYHSHLNFKLLAAIALSPFNRGKNRSSLLGA